MPPLPTGTVTMLFTDIEGSTRLLTELGDGYAGVLAEHRRVLREAIERHGGVAMETQGDAFFVVFGSASDAVAAAADAQQALASGPVLVRMGLHTGEPVLTEQGYVGLDVHRAARIGAAGHGGQILISQATRKLVDGDLELCDLGEHRLKDLPEPLRLFQLGRLDFPPLRSLNQALLPSDLDPLIGRKRELGEILRLLTRERVRALTITGPGGIGKTRLATAAAQELVESFDDGVTFVDLAAIRDPALVLPRIAEALGVEDPAAHLATQEHLLVLDNVEQVIDAAPDLARLLAASPRLAILATSRERLRIAGERAFPLRPLSEAPAVELFRQRAEAVLPEFEAEYAQLAEICRRLDNLPLAIELAAARVKVLPPGELLRRLDRRLPVLTAARRDLPERQQTLRATIEWSHELLTPDEQQLFARLGVFSGGCLLEAAEAVCDAELDTITSLVDKSLLRTDGNRVRMLETILEYARDQLEASGGLAELRRRHATFYAALAERARPHLRGPRRDWLDYMEAEHDNLRAVLDWSLEAGDLELGFRVAESLIAFWHLRAHQAEGLRWLDKAIARAHVLEPTTRASGLDSLGNLLFFEGEFKRAEEALEESLSLYRAAGDRSRIADVLNSLGNATWALGDRKRTRRLREEALELSWELRDAHAVARTLHYVGEESRDDGDLVGARRAFEESIDVMSELGDKSFVLASLHGLGDLELDARNYAAAAERYRECLGLAMELEIRRFVVYALAGLASTATTSGDLGLAGRLWGAVVSMEEQPGLRILSFERQRYEVALRDHLSDPVFREAVAEGRQLAAEDAVQEALALDGSGASTASM